MDSAIYDFIAPSTGADGSSFHAIPVWQPSRLLGVNESADDGVDALLATLKGQTGQVVVFGFSQSTVAEVRVRAELQAMRERGETVPDVTFVGIGVGNRPNGGISSRFAGVTLPFFDFSFDGPQPNNDTDFKFIDIARQYDALADLPQFPMNPVATANAVLGFTFVHLLYGEEVSLDPDSPKYVPGTVSETVGNTTYYWIPTVDLPLLDPLRLIGVPEQALDIVEPFVKVLVEAGYDRSVPFGEPTPAQLIPVIDPVTLGVQLLAAAVEGANNAAAIGGGHLPGYGPLTQRLAAAVGWTTETIGTPYRDIVRAANEVFNPFEAFAALTGPPARYMGTVLNPLLVRTLSTVVDPVVAAVTTRAEKNVLFPQGPSGPLAHVLINLLKRVAPHLGAAPTTTRPGIDAISADGPAASTEVKTTDALIQQRIRQRSNDIHDPPAFAAHGRAAVEDHSPPEGRAITDGVSAIDIGDAPTNISGKVHLPADIRDRQRENGDGRHSSWTTGSKTSWEPSPYSPRAERKTTQKTDPPRALDKPTHTPAAGRAGEKSAGAAARADQQRATTRPPRPLGADSGKRSTQRTSGSSVEASERADSGGEDQPGRASDTA
ncbi:PE-PPE domain-containing protein [Mycobacterium syngnathidarum]